MTVGNEEIRVCQSCSENMFVSEEELERVREELNALRKEFRDVNEKFGQEKVLNSKYSQDIESLNQALSEQKRRASVRGVRAWCSRMLESGVREFQLSFHFFMRVSIERFHVF